MEREGSARAQQMGSTVSTAQEWLLSIVPSTQEVGTREATLLSLNPEDNSMSKLHCACVHACSCVFIETLSTTAKMETN